MSSLLIAVLCVACDARNAGPDPGLGVTGSTGVSTPTETAESSTSAAEPSETVGDESSGGDATGDGAPAVVDPGCIDGAHQETLPDPSADISDLVETYEAGEYKAFIAAVLRRRYPVGADIVERALTHAEIGDCIDVFVDGTGTAQDVIDQLPLLVHECGHFLDLAQSARASVYVLSPELSFSCQGGSVADWGGRTFSRNRLNDDVWSSLRPPCSGNYGPDCDGWADVYLDGDPDDDVDEGGDQGFDMLFEELVQYTGSLATTYAIQDELGYSVHERDGSLTFLWYLTRYLQLARTDYPDTYELLVGDECWRTAILTVWGRAWLYLDATEAHSDLGEFDDLIEPLTLEPELLAEIGRLRTAAGCE